MSDRARGITVNQVVGVLTSLTYLRTSLDVTSSYQLAQLHTEYSKWLLRDLPPAIGVTLFTNLDIQGVPSSKVANFFDPTEVVKILDTVSGGATTRVALVSAYLQIVLGDDCNGHPKEQLHDLQVKVLLELIAEQRGATDKADTAADKKLLQFLEKSKAYNPKTVQQWLDQGAYAPSLFRQRVVVYQRQNLHQKAITMFLQEARDMAAAQAYATSASKREEGGGADNAFQILLQELTRPNDADTKEITTAKTQQALKVINSCEGVDAKTALPMLPDETLLADLSSFLIASLRASHTNRRNLEIAAAVSTTQMNQTRTSELLHKKRYVIVDDASMCCKCGFKIRIDTMFAVFPNGNVAHQLCYDDDKVDPGTHEDFSKGVHTIFLQ